MTQRLCTLDDTPLRGEPIDPTLRAACPYGGPILGECRYPDCSADCAGRLNYKLYLAQRDSVGITALAGAGDGAKPRSPPAPKLFPGEAT